MQVRPIRTQEDYKAMLAAVSALIDLDPAPDSPEGERLEVLVGDARACCALTPNRPSSGASKSRKTQT